MSEHAPQQPEATKHHEHHGEHHVDHHEAVRQHEAQRTAQEHEAAHNQLRQQAEVLTHKAQEHAARKEQYNHLHQDQDDRHHGPMLVNAELKTMALKRTLTRVRKDLSAPDKVLSKVVHQPAVNAISEVGEKTVARPSGILTGGIFAFVGTSLVLYICKHYGYSYNFLLFALLFVGGFCLGLFIELGVNMLRHRRNA